MSDTSTGARVIFRVDGAKVAFAQSFGYDVNHDHEAVNVLDQLEPAEYAETGYRVSFTATLFRVDGQGAQAAGLRPQLQNILTQPELQAELIDRVTGQTLQLINRVKCTSESLNVDARSLAQVNLSFVGITESQGDA